MSLEKMKYQLKDWYEGTQPNYVGKKIQGVNGTITNFTLISTAGSLTFDSYYWKNIYDVSTLSATQVNSQKVVYQIYSHISHPSYNEPDQVFLGFTLKHVYDRHRNEYDDVMCWVKLNDILSMGGYWPSLYTRLRSAFRKAVVGC